MDRRNNAVVSLGRALIGAGTVLLLIAAYGQAISTQPLALVSEASIQILGSFIMLTVGVALTAPSLKPMTWQAELRKHSIDQTDSKLSFADVHHRGTLLFKDD